MKYVRGQVDVDRPRPSGAGLAEGHGHVFGNSGGAVHLHCHLGNAPVHGHVIRLLESTGVAAFLGAGTAQDDQWQAVVECHMGTGHAIAYRRASGQYGDTHLVLDKAIRGRREGRGLLVAHPDGTHAKMRAKPHDVLYGAACQAKEGLDSLTLDRLGYQ